MSSARVDRPADGRKRSRPSASFAGSPASSSRHATKGQRPRAADGRLYADLVLDRYLWLPGTPARTSRNDRRLATALCARGIPFAIVHAALLLGTARRSFRSGDAPPLPPIRTLHYFLPLIEELLEQPPAAGYLEYIESKLLPLAEAKAAHGTMSGRDRSIVVSRWSGEDRRHEP